MQILDSKKNLLPLPPPSIITIGLFDGVHKGHQALLYRMKTLKEKLQKPISVITFTDHPSRILQPKQSIPLLFTLEHRLEILRQFDIDFVLPLPFTQELASQSPEEFFYFIRSIIPFFYVVLGCDAVLGANKSGSPNNLEKISRQQNFLLEYIKQYGPDEEAHKLYSSTNIRLALKEGNLSTVKELLGRPFSIFEKAEKGYQIGQQLGYPTLNFPVADLCLPPLGVYVVLIKSKTQIKKGIANLGYAPTFEYYPPKIRLEVHILEDFAFGNQETLEIFLCKFLRAEKKFSSREELISAIQEDIRNSKIWLEGNDTPCFL